MRLLRLSLSGFMSWDRLDLDLSECDVVGVVGRVGNGKSAILDGLLWTIYGEGRASADAMVRQGEDRCTVEVAFEAAGHRALVRRERERGRSTALTLEVDGRSLTRHTVAETQAAVDELVGVSSDALLATAVMVQGRSDEFVRLRPAERMALLSDLVVEDPYPAWHEEAKQRRDAARAEVDRAEARRALLAEQGERAGEYRTAAERQAAAAERAREEAESGQRALHDASASTAGMRAAEEQRVRLEAEVARVAEERERLEAEVRRLRAIEAQPDPPAPPRPDPEPLRQAEADAASARSAATDLRLARAALGEAAREEQRVRALAYDRSAMPCRGEGIYASCPLLATIPSAEQVQAVVAGARDAEWAVLALEVLAGPAEARREEAERLREEWRAWEQATIAAGAAREALKARRADAADGIAAAAARLASLATTDVVPTEPEVDRLAAREAMIAALREDAEQAAAAARRLGEQAAVSAREADRAEQAAREALAVQAEVVRQSGLAQSYAALAEAWHPYGIPRLIVEEAIPRIEAHANEALGRLPGGFTLRLSTSREKRTGGSMDTLDVVVEIGGRERDYALLSGGERFRVDLALRLGIAGLLAERTGRKVSTLWLDEPLAPGDEQEREAVTESIAALADQYPLIVIVSHDAEFADALPWVLRVTKQDGASRAELVQQ